MRRDRAKWLRTIADVLAETLERPLSEARFQPDVWKTWEDQPEYYLQETGLSTWSNGTRYRLDPSFYEEIEPYWRKNKHDNYQALRDLTPVG